MDIITIQPGSVLVDMSYQLKLFIGISGILFIAMVLNCSRGVSTTNYDALKKSSWKKGADTPGSAYA